MGAVDGLPEVMTDATVRSWNQNLKDGGKDAMIPYYAILKMVDEGTPMPEVLTEQAADPVYLGEK